MTEQALFSSFQSTFAPCALLDLSPTPGRKQGKQKTPVLQTTEKRRQKKEAQEDTMAERQS